MTSEGDHSSNAESVAQWIGPSESPLFAWLDLPSDGKAVGAAILCPSMGLEAAYSARALRELGIRLATHGWAVLRFDYTATGDSAGTWTDPDLVSAWRKDLRCAIDYACSLRAPRVAAVGLRIGATLAAAELSVAGGVDDLVLWDPCATGKGFLREQRALWAFRRNQAVQWGILQEGEDWGATEVPEDGSFEAPGAPFTAQTASDLRSLTVGPGDRPLASLELVLAREGRKLDRALADRVRLPHVELFETAGQDLLLDVDAITPEPTLDEIIAWLGSPTHDAVRIDVPRPETAAIHAVAGRDVSERPLDIGPLHLFGILSEPADTDASHRSPTVLFLNVGRIGHQGPARFWVEQARSLSSAGVRCVRVDLNGLGDSPTRPHRTENVEFPADALDDLREVRRAMVANFGTDIVLVGLCSGGYHAIESALDEPCTSVCAINPALATYRWSEQPFRRFEPNEGDAIEEQKAWGATRPWVSRLMVRLARFQGAVRKVPGARWALKRFLVKASPARMFETLAKSGVPILVIAGTEEARRLSQGEERRVGALTRTGALSLETVSGLEHTLLERTGRDRVAELMQAWILGTGTDGAARARREAAPTNPVGHLMPNERDRALRS